MVRPPGANLTVRRKLSLKRQIKNLHEIHKVAHGSFGSVTVHGQQAGANAAIGPRHFLDVSVFPFS